MPNSVPPPPDLFRHRGFKVCQTNCRAQLVWVKVFNKIWAKMALVDSFYPSFWSKATSLSKKCLAPTFPSLWKKNPCVFLFIFLHQPTGIVGSAAVDTHVPDCFLGQASRSWSGDVEENMDERKKKERSSSGATEPLQLFKWPLSLCTCSLCLVWILKWPPPPPKNGRYSEDDARAMSKRLSMLDFHISARAVDEQETVDANDCVTLKRKIFLSRMA